MVSLDDEIQMWLSIGKLMGMKNSCAWNAWNGCDQSMCMIIIFDCLDV